MRSGDKTRLMKRIEALGARRRSPRDDYVDSLPADESIKEFKRVCRDLHHSGVTAAAASKGLN